MYKPPPRTIRQVFESLPEGTWCQVVNNRLIMSPACNYQHQSTSRDVLIALDSYVEQQKLGEVVMGPIDTYLDDENIFQPDLLFISNERSSIIKDCIYGAPDLVVEILLPESEDLDKIEKKEAYERYGVKEYRLVDPISREIIVYRLAEHKFVEIPSQPCIIQSPLLNTTIKL